ncbi:unnamed protein product [Auanema sp. JU1783]|nr:unnamed protein product [Auanema sp. JU1783]
MKFVILSLLVLQVQCDFNQLFSRIQNSDHASQLQNHLSSLSNTMNAKIAPFENLTSFFKEGVTKVEPVYLGQNDDHTKKIVQNVRDLLERRANQTNETVANLKNIMQSTKESFLNNTSNLKDIAVSLKNLDSHQFLNRNASEFIDHIKKLHESGEMKNLMTKHAESVLNKIFGNLSDSCLESFNTINSNVMTTKINEMEQKVTAWGVECGQTEKINEMTGKVLEIAQTQSDHLDRIIGDLAALKEKFKTLVANKDQTLVDLMKAQANIMAEHPDSSHIFTMILAQVHRNTTAALQQAQFGFPSNDDRMVRPAINSDRAQIQILPLSVKESSPMAAAVEATDDMFKLAVEEEETDQNQDKKDKKNKKNKNKKNKNKKNKNKDSSESDEAAE